MLKNKRNNLTKNNIKEIINRSLGLPKSFSENFLVNVFDIITINLKKNNLIKIKNFGSFKVLNKNKDMKESSVPWNINDISKYH